PRSAVLLLGPSLGLALRAIDARRRCSKSFQTTLWGQKSAGLPTQNPAPRLREPSWFSPSGLSSPRLRCSKSLPAILSLLLRLWSLTADRCVRFPTRTPLARHPCLASA